MPAIRITGSSDDTVTFQSEASSIAAGSHRLDFSHSNLQQLFIHSVVHKEASIQSAGSDCNHPDAPYFNLRWMALPSSTPNTPPSDRSGEEWKSGHSGVMPPDSRVRLYGAKTIYDSIFGRPTGQPVSSLSLS
jgi:hypothetical protein